MEEAVKTVGSRSRKTLYVPPSHGASRGGMRTREVHAALGVVQDELKVAPDRDERGPRGALGERVEDGLDVALRLD